MDIITNISRGNSFYMTSKEYEIPEIKLFGNEVSSSRFIIAARSEQLIGRLTSKDSEYEKDQIASRFFYGDRIKDNNLHLNCVVNTLIRD